MLKKFQLKNGLKVLAVQSHKSPVVSVQMWVRTGSADESPKVQGISHFIEHLVFKGTAKYGLGQIASTVEGSGGELNAYTTFDQTVFYVTISKDFMTTGMDVVSQMMGFPKFDAGEIDNEREVVIEEIKRGNDSVHRQASRHLFEAVYKKHAYGKPVIGYEQIIRKVSREAIMNYYHSRYVPKNMTLVVAGDFEWPDLKKQLQQHFAPFEPYKLKTVKRTLEPAQKSARVQVHKTSFQENILYLAWPIPGVRHKDIPALDVLSMTLGQGESSRLNRSLRLEKPLVHYAGASTFTPMNPGFFAISASLKLENLRETLDIIGNDLMRLREQPATSKEFEKAHINFASEEGYSVETVDGLARKVGTYNLLFDDPGYQKKFLEQVMAVSPLDIAKGIEKYLHPKALSVVLTTDQEVEPQIRLIKGWLADWQKMWSKPKKRQAQAFKPTRARKLRLPKTKDGSSEVVREVLPSGTVLLIRPNYDAPVVSLRCGFLGGMRAEGSKYSGSTELLSRTWVSATKKTSEHDLYHKIESVASNLSAFGGRNTMGLSMTTLPAFTPTMLDLFEEVLLEPVFPDEVLHREKLAVQEALRTRQDNTAQIAILNFMKMLYPNHPYSQDPLGDPETLQGLTAADLQQRLSAHLQQKNGVVAVSGYLDMKKDVPRLKAIFERLPKGQRYSDSARFVPPPQSNSQIQYAKKEQSHVVIGFSGLSLTDPRRYALQVVQAILAGQGGRLFLELRDKASLAYSVSPLRMEGTDTGYFGAYIGCSPEKVGQSLRMLRAEFSKITSEKVPPAELERAKKYLIGRHHIDLQRNSAIGSSVLFDEIYGIPYDETFHFADRVHALSADDVQEIAGTIFAQPEIVSVVGPHEQTLVLK